MSDVADGAAVPGSANWLDLVVEEIVDPAAEIVDPHHHLWPAGEGMNYKLADLEADLDSGHRVVDTVFVECGAGYRQGDDPMAAVAETRFVAADAAASSRPLMGGIVAHATSAVGISRRCSTPTRRPATAGCAASVMPAHMRSIPRC